MEENSMYDKLLLLPLFQGLCKEDFTNILEKVKLHFQKYTSGHYIAKQDDPCNGLTFILQGQIMSESTDKTHHYTLYETLDAPHVIEPYSLFGMHQQYNASYSALGNVHTITIDKSYVVSELSKYSICQLNYVNLLCNRNQTFYRRLWNAHIGNTQNKIINFLLLRCTTISGYKKLHVRMEDLAELLDDTRINISKVLNDWKQQGLASLSRREIEIPDMNDLLAYNQQNNNDIL